MLYISQQSCLKEVELSSPEVDYYCEAFMLE